METQFSMNMDYSAFIDRILKKSLFIAPEHIAMQIKRDGQSINWSYKQLLEEISKKTARIKTLGLQSHDRVIILSENSPESMIAFYSILLANCVPVFLDPQLAENELLSLIEFSEVRLILVSKKYSKTYHQLLSCQVAVRAIEDDFELYNDGQYNVLSSTKLDFDVAVILFTSGTTDHSKGVMLTFDNLLQAILKGKLANGMVEKDRILTVLPIHHISPLIFNLITLYSGATLIFVNEVNGENILRAMQETKPTITGFVPLILELFLNQIETKIASLNPISQHVLSVLNSGSLVIKNLSGINLNFFLNKKIQQTFGGKLSIIICGGSGLNPNVLKKLQRYGFTILQAYGLTESSGPIVSNPKKKIKADSVGKPYSNLEIKIEPENPRDLAGEICIKGPMVMKGYFKDEKYTQEKISDGWFHTGDIGYFDSDGYLKLTGRSKELIVLASGKKVHPIEIEKIFKNSALMSDMVILGINPSNSYDEQIHAIIVLQKQYQDLMQIKKMVTDDIFKKNTTISPEKRIHLIYFVDELPRTTSFKLKRNEIKQWIVGNKIQPFYYLEPENSESEMSQWILSWICKNKNLAPETISLNKPLHTYGLNSLNCVQLCKEFSAQFNYQLHPAALWEHPSISHLINYIVSGKQESTCLVQGQSNSQTDEPIAIISMSCRLPGNINTPESLWNILIKGENIIQTVPGERWSQALYYDPNPDAPGKINSCYGGFLKDIKEFDASFFEISPTEAQNMDPQQRILLETCWEALERGGINPDSIVESNTGVYIGACTNDYGLLQAQKNNSRDINPYYCIGNSLSALAARISYFLGLKGVSKVVDTACSSSLVAVHDACQDLQLGNVSMAIVGGVNLILSPLPSISLSKARMLSSDGQCKVFDEQANGYVRSEGCCVIVLKKLSDAKKDKDMILATIQGWAVNQSGFRNGITAPNGLAQTKLYEMALKKAQLQSSQIQYVEAHGTGTALGDPIEARSIINIYGKERKAEAPLYVGSIKGNLGHMEAGAGLVGLLKTVLLLQHKKIPPQVNIKKINPLVEFEQHNIQIPTSQIKLSHTPLNASVSAFGFTGTNAHIVISEGENISSNPHPLEKKEYLFAFSSKTQEGLLKQLEAMRLWLEQVELANDFSLANISYSLNVCRKHFDHRYACVASNLIDLKSQIKNAIFLNDASERRQEIFNNTSAASQKLAKMMSAYLNGEYIDWAVLHEDVPKQKMILPTYQFQRRPYWFNEIEKVEGFSANLSHPFLSKRVFTACKDNRIFESHISQNSPLFLHDHRVLGQIIVPAASYITCILCLCRQFLKHSEQVDINNFSISSPFILDENKQYLLQTNLHQSSDNYYKIEFHQCDMELLETNHSWSKLASADVQNLSRQDLFYPELPLDIKSRCNTYYDKETLYKKIHTEGFEYNNAFTAILNCWANINESLTELNDFISGDTNLTGILDSCFQAIFGILLSQSKKVLYLPIGIGQFKIHSINHPKWVYAKLNPQTSFNDHMISINLILWDENNQIIGKIDDFQVKRISQINTIDDSVQNSYEAIWQPQILLTHEPKAIKGDCLVYSNQNLWAHHFCQKFSDEKTRYLAISNCDELKSKTTVSSAIFYYAYESEGEASLSIQGLQDIQKEIFESLLFLVKSLNPSETMEIWLITSAQFVHSSIIGFAKTLQFEYPNFKVKCLQLDCKRPQDHIEIIINEFQFNRFEEQVKYRFGVRFVSKLNTLQETMKNREELKVPQSEYFRLAIPNRGLIQNLVLEPCFPEITLEPKELIIEAKAGGLNFRDVLNTLDLYPGDAGDLGGDFSGVVKTVGNQVSLFKPGDEVFGFSVNGGFNQCVKTHESLVVKKPGTISAYQVSAVPTVFLTALISLKKIAQLKAGEKVLIHAASGGVGLASIQMAHLLGATVFATAGNEEKRNYLKSLGIQYIYDSRTTHFAQQILADTQGLGVDVVLNSLSGEGFINSSVLIASKNARFIEIGKRNIWTQHQMQVVRPDINYQIFALDDLIKLNPDYIKQGLTELVNLFEQQLLKPIPISLYPIIHSKQAFRNMQQAQHIGKIVIALDKPTYKIKAHASYLITGGIGALGLNLVEHLCKNNAKHLVLVSRSKPNLNTCQTINALEKTYKTKIEMVFGDIANEKFVSNLMNQFDMDYPPLKGIFHLAGILNDKMIHAQNWSDFNMVFAAKVYGAWNLHRYTQDMNLDLFVCFSSIASTIGSPGQSNYAAANSFLDGLIMERNQLGLPGLSINWGPWAGEGMAHQHNDTLANRGINALSPNHCLTLLDELLKQSQPNVLVASINWQKFSKHMLFESTLLNDCLKNFEIKKVDTQHMSRLKDINDSNARLDFLYQILKDIVSKILGVANNELEIDSDFDNLGMDSLMAFELHNMIDKEFGHNILSQVTSISSYNNIRDLALYIHDKLFPNEMTEKITNIEVVQTSTFDNELDFLDKDLTEVKHYTERVFNPPWHKRLPQMIIRGLIKNICKVYFKIEINGLEHLPKKGSFFICPNHTSYLDSVLFGMINKKIRNRFVGLLAKDYFEKKSFKLISLLTNVIPFDRTSNELVFEKNLSYINACIEKQGILILFPEGTRSFNGELQEFKAGVAWFAQKTGLDIIPAYINGAFELWPRGRYFPKPGKISISFGKAINIKTENQGMSTLSLFTKSLQENVVNLKNMQSSKHKQTIEFE